MTHCMEDFSKAKRATIEGHKSSRHKVRGFHNRVKQVPNAISTEKALIADNSK